MENGSYNQSRTLFKEEMLAREDGKCRRVLVTVVEKGGGAPVAGAPDTAPVSHPLACPCT